MLYKREHGTIRNYSLFGVPKLLLKKLAGYLVELSLPLLLEFQFVSTALGGKEMQLLMGQEELLHL
jgi:hypothetical protein